MMKFRAGRASSALALALGVALSIGYGFQTNNAEAGSGYAANVDENGNISLPDGDFRRDWTFLGTYAVDDEESEEGAKSFHNVYAERDAVNYYRENGQFADGTVLVKELRNTHTDAMTTGTVSRATDIAGWFVMIKDTEGRFQDSPLWGDGWGWAFFEAGNPQKTVTKDYQADCLGCHSPAAESDWLYTEGYPVLKPFGSESADAAGAAATMGAN